MTLERYLALTKQSDAAFGAKCKSGEQQRSIHRTRIWSYRTGRSKPMADHIAAIEVASEGNVKAQDWTPAAPRQGRSATVAA